MSADGVVDAAVEAVVVCHIEPLIAAATAAYLESSRTARHAVGVSSVAHLLSRLDRSVPVAVVYDTVDEDLADVLEALHHRRLGTLVVVVVSSADPGYAASLLEAGAAGFAYAWGGAEELSSAVRDVRPGRVVVPRGGRSAVLDAVAVRRQAREEARLALACLTDLDVRILRGLCDGVTVTRLAERLLLSPHTIRGRVRVIGSALGVRGQLGIAAAGRRLLAAAQIPMDAGGFGRGDGGGLRLAARSS